MHGRTRSPGTPPAFPYTTLFRSGSRVAPPAASGREVVLRLGRGDRPSHRERGAVREVPAVAAPDAGVDRKSTRLNSSHVESSYAVFCLKKKNIEGRVRTGRHHGI